MSGTTDGALGGELTRLLGSLIAIPTAYPPGDTREMAAHLVALLEGWGYECAVHARTQGLENVVARLGAGSPSLVFNAHVDTVGPGAPGEWDTPPYEAVQRGERIYGLGAVNCKGSAAVQLWLAREIARRGGPASGEVLFTFVTDEENIGPDGMAYLRESGAVRPDMLVLGAPTGNRLILEERGVLWAELRTHGRTAHAGQPEHGDNAVLRMLRLLGTLHGELETRLATRRHGSLRSTWNLGVLHGGANTNVVPNACLAQIDRRLLPDETVQGAFDEMRAIIEAAGEPAESYGFELMRGTPGYAGDGKGRVATALAEATAAVTGKPAGYATAVGVSDGRYFAGDGIEIVNYGPGAGELGHAANEWVRVGELVEAARVLDATFERVLGYAQPAAT